MTDSSDEPNGKSPESNSNRKQDDPSSISDLLDINFNPNSRPGPPPVSPPTIGGGIDPWGMPSGPTVLPTSAGVSPQHSSMASNQQKV